MGPIRFAQLNEWAPEFLDRRTQGLSMVQTSDLVNHLVQTSKSLNMYVGSSGSTALVSRELR